MNRKTLSHLFGAAAGIYAGYQGYQFIQQMNWSWMVDVPATAAAVWLMYRFTSLGVNEVFHLKGENKLFSTTLRP